MISLWLLISFCLQLEHFGFANFMLLGSSLLPVWSIFFVTVSLLHFDAPFFSNLREHFLLRSITFWFFEADAVLCVPSFQLDIFQVLWFWCVFQYFDFWWVRCAAPVRWNMIFMMQLITRSAHNSNITFCILEGSVFECLFALTKNYFDFFEIDVLLVRCATPWLSFSTW